MSSRLQEDQLRAGKYMGLIYWERRLAPKSASIQVMVINMEFKCCAVSVGADVHGRIGDNITGTTIYMYI